MSSSPTQLGALYVVATPIGNLGDLTLRAREILSTVDVIAAEDTRHTNGLLHAMGISKRLVSLHEHNERARIQGLLDDLTAGRSIALVSDAGTPLISDPGYGLVSAAIEAGIRVVPLPGPCAVTAALSIAGLATDRFVFEGFLAAKHQARLQRLNELKAEMRTLVFYEAPHRLAEALTDLGDVLGMERRAVVCRELTKAFESTYRGPLRALAERARIDPDMTRGEIVIVVEGATAELNAESSSAAAEVLKILLQELSPSQSAKLAARLTGGKRNDLYALALQLAGTAP